MTIRTLTIIAVTILLLWSCNKKENKLSHKDSVDTTTFMHGQYQDTLTNFQLNYEKSMIHRSYDSDSLLLDIEEVKQLIALFTKKTRAKEKEYGAGDYFGKYRIYVHNSDTLILDKGDGGDYGFSNSIYLKRSDSIVLYREYELDGLADSIKEEVIKFKKNEVIFTKRSKAAREWGELKFGTIKFDTVKKDPSGQYKALQKQLRKLFELELVE